MICALPLVRRLRAGFPAARIDLLASERNAPIVQDLPVADISVEAVLARLDSWLRELKAGDKSDWSG